MVCHCYEYTFTMKYDRLSCDVVTFVVSCCQLLKERCEMLSAIKSLNNRQFLLSEPPYAVKKNQLEMLCLPLEKETFSFPCTLFALLKE